MQQQLHGSSQPPSGSSSQNPWIQQAVSRVEIEDHLDWVSYTVWRSNLAPTSSDNTLRLCTLHTLIAGLARTKNHWFGGDVVPSCLTCIVDRADVDACDSREASYEAQSPCSEEQGSPNENGDNPSSSSSATQSSRSSRCHAATWHSLGGMLLRGPSLKPSKSFCMSHQGFNSTSLC